ncbi:uncharacterized protein [Aegilops tauschii subsp. strangulata]|uniref:uncharacterized protein isoform X1 n=1 Tax=Aegilops tauschii subsp. strangulata TaxID=200361 RepID=UPI003CC88EBB
MGTISPNVMAPSLHVEDLMAELVSWWSSSSSGLRLYVCNLKIDYKLASMDMHFSTHYYVTFSIGDPAKPYFLGSPSLVDCWLCSPLFCNCTLTPKNKAGGMACNLLEMC